MSVEIQVSEKTYDSLSQLIVDGMTINDVLQFLIDYYENDEFNNELSN